MYQKIRNRLILIYTATTGVILSAVILVVYFMNENQMKANQVENFRNNVYSISSKLQSENGISNTWLSTTEEKNNLIIYIEDNKKPLLWHGTWMEHEERSYLIETAISKAVEHGIDISIPPVSYTDVRGDYNKIVGNDGTRYYSAVIIIPNVVGYRSAVLLQYFSSSGSFLSKQFLLYIVIDILGILALYLVSKTYISKTMYPVEESRKKQADFIAAASHELKSPLTVIRTSASAVSCDKDNGDHYLATIENECTRMATLVDDLLLLSSTDARNWTMRSSQVELDTVLINIFETYERTCQNNNFELRIELPENILPKILGDEVRIGQAIVILLDNALCHSKGSGALVIRAYAKKSYVYLEVEDHGIGIQSEKKELIFERFYREDKARKDKMHFGLGLSIAKELVTLHGGTISLRDTAGGGCTFVIKLPIINQIQ